MKLMVFDNTQQGFENKYLSEIWGSGSYLGSFDIVEGVTSWSEVYDLLAGLPRVPGNGMIEEIQFWGHGISGGPLINGKRPTLKLLNEASYKLTNQTSKWWFRSCDVLSREAGKEFANEFVRVMDCAIAGHTHIVSGVDILGLLVPTPFQSGGHIVYPGERAMWLATEGVNKDGSSRGSMPWYPNTCLVTQMKVPKKWSNR